MSTSFNRFVVTQALGIATFNAGINSFYTWALWRSKSTLTLFAENAIAFDLSSTAAWIAVLSTLLGTSAIRTKLRDGRVTTPAMRAAGHLHLLPKSILARAAVLGAAAGIVLGLPVWIMLGASGINEVSLTAAILTKVAITVPMSLLIVPLVILAGLADVQPRRGGIAIA